MLPPVENGWRPPLDGVDYGSFPDNYETLIREWHSKNLKDPDSARYRHISRPRKEHAIENQFQQKAVYGYSVCATVNARNSYGGYTGDRTMWFLISNGVIVRFQDASKPIYIGRMTNCVDGVPPADATESSVH